MSKRQMLECARLDDSTAKLFAGFQFGHKEAQKAQASELLILF